MENMGSTNVTSRCPFFHLLLLNGKISAQSNNVSYKIFQHDIVIKVQKQNCSLCPVSLPTFFLSFSAFIWASISSGLVYVLIRPLWPPFLPVTMAKKKKNHITQICIHVSKKAFNLQSCLNCYLRHFKNTLACITHILISLQQKLEHGPKILPNIDEADGIAMCHLQNPSLCYKWQTGYSW